MKTTAKKKRNPGENSTASRVRLELTHPTAKTVCVAGTFNGWGPTATEMVNLGKGRWVKELTLPPGQYEYRLVVDGEWIADPKAKETAPNPFGGLNSVLKVPPSANH